MYKDPSTREVILDEEAEKILDHSALQVLINHLCYKSGNELEERERQLEDIAFLLFVCDLYNIQVDRVSLDDQEELVHLAQMLGDLYQKFGVL